MPLEYAVMVLVIYLAYLAVFAGLVWFFINLDDILEKFP